MSKELCNVMTEIETKSMLDETGKEIGVKRTVLTSRTHQIIKKRKDDMFFHFFYESEFFPIILSLNGSEIKTLLALAAKTKLYNNKDWTEHHHLGNVVMVNSKVIEEINEESGLSENTVKPALRTLVKKKLLLRDDPVRKGVYYLNPKLIFNGATYTRTKVLNNLRDDSYTIEVEE